jgi:hypothetical protein
VNRLASNRCCFVPLVNVGALFSNEATWRGVDELRGGSRLSIEARAGMLSIMDATLSKPLDRRALLLFLGVGLSIVVVWTILLRGPLYSTHPSFAAFGVAFDLAVGLPAFWYFIAVRPRRASPGTLVPIAVLGLIAAHAMTPGDPPAVTLVLALLVELAALFAVAWRVKHAARQSEGTGSPFERIEVFSNQLVPSRAATGILASEIGMLWFAFLSWKQPPPRGERVVRWANVEDWTGVMIGLVVVVVAEAIGLHLWLMTEWPRAVWFLTLSDLYAIIWLVADARALGLSSVRSEGGVVDIRFGLRWSASVPAGQIESIERVAGEGQVFDLELSLVEAPRTRVTFREPVPFRGPYGIRRSVRSVGLLLEDELTLPPSSGREVPSKEGMRSQLPGGHEVTASDSSAMQKQKL